LPYILVIGTNFKHKNRPYAIRLFREIIDTYHWPGILIFVGPNVTSGGSAAEEATEMTQSASLKSRVVYLGTVNEDDKGWLLQHAALVLYPTNYEGFGFVPFEAATAGTPAISSAGTSLGEVLGQNLLYLDLANIHIAAETVYKILSDPAIASSQVQAIRTRAATYTWRNTANATWSFYKHILALPPRSHHEPYTTSRTRATNPHVAIDVAVHTWAKRLVKGARILITRGAKPFMNEIRQYLRWRLG
jgi:glycosyltransferase involved in cell wall biosynthesis